MAIRYVSIIMAACLLLLANVKVDKLHRDLISSFPGVTAEADYARFSNTAIHVTANDVGFLKRVATYSWRWMRAVNPNCWVLADRHRDLAENVQLDSAWQDYLVLGGRHLRFARVLVLTIAYWLLFGTLVPLLPPDQPPFRGIVSQVAYYVLVWTSDLLLTWLTFFVVDAVAVSRLLVGNLSTGRSHWPAASLDRLRISNRQLSDAELNEVLDVSFVGKYTAVIGKLIYLPFLLLVAIILARTDFFDRNTTAFLVASATRKSAQIMLRYQLIPAMAFNPASDIK